MNSDEEYNNIIQSNDSNLIFQLGIKCRKDKDYQKAKKLYELAVEKGNHKAMCNLGLMYLNGHGVSKDYNKAKELFEQANVEVDCSNNLGIIYNHALGVTADYQKAKKFYEMGIERGDSNALVNLGKMYEIGSHHKDYSNECLFIEIEKSAAMVDLEKAKELFELAHQQNNASGTQKLGSLYIKLGNYQKAIELLELAVSNGNTIALIEMGDIYAEGFGVTKDCLKARDLYEKAYQLGKKEALDKLVMLYRTDLNYDRDYAFEYFLSIKKVNKLQSIYNIDIVIKHFENLVIKLKNKNEKLKQENNLLKDNRPIKIDI